MGAVVQKSQGKDSNKAHSQRKVLTQREMLEHCLERRQVELSTT